jgi:hypothetical protein
MAVGYYHLCHIDNYRAASSDLADLRFTAYLQIGRYDLDNHRVGRGRRLPRLARLQAKGRRKAEMIVLDLNVF